MSEYEIMDGNDIFELARNSELNKAGQETDSVVRSFIRSTLDPGILDPNLDPAEAETVIALMNLINAIRWFIEINEGN